MKIINLVNLFAVLMLTLALGGVALSFWTTNQAERYNARIALAHESYERHLHLTINTYTLFKQFGDAMLIGDQDQGAGEAELIARIRADVAEIRRIIGTEIELVGEEEIEELELLAEIERLIEDLIVRFEVFKQADQSSEMRRDWESLSNILTDEIDRDFQVLIDEALAEEEEELRETNAAAAAHAKLTNQIAWGFATLSVLVTLLALLTYRRQISTPFQRLIAAARAFEGGYFSTRVRADGNSEISEVGKALDDMAEKVEMRTRALQKQNDVLEDAVAARTADLERLLNEAEVSEANRRQLLADVSHELRTPLTIIQGETDMALRGDIKSTAEYQEALRRARDTARHTTRLVDDLLFMSRQEAGEVRLELKTTDLVGLLRETLATFDQGVPLTTPLDMSPQQIDPLRVRQSVLALLQNARRHGGSDMSVHLENTPDGVGITVLDNGPGMPDAEKKLAFDRFFRGSNGSESYSEGTGLGLPLVRSIARAHGGTAVLADRPGGGLAASIELPAKPALRAVS
ncbi:sensor histidine kinase [Litoreibacter roseus]|uniref:histidine kinase n=1 Tax=Litoreibacter roseus TaxID=2601869 RepID=A0A6N6JHC0_9RHOB|nr:ATP-binding protein [Litoreibacter roseus]GFE65525.1 two-component sensor histidine kinase [Litoreibacter roseus]